MDARQEDGVSAEFSSRFRLSSAGLVTLVVALGAIGNTVAILMLT